MGEIAQHACTMRGVDHFRMELGAVITPLWICDHGIGRARRARDDTEPSWHLGDMVAMAHPDFLAFAKEETIEEMIV